MGDHVDPADRGGAAGRDDPSREHPDGRGLARAVRAEQPEDLAGADREVEPVDRTHHAAPLPKTFVSPTVRMTSSGRLGARFARVRPRRPRHPQSARWVCNESQSLGLEKRGELTQMTRPVFSAAMSGGLRVGFHGVRGSTPCEGPQYARYGGHSSCVSVERRRPAADRVRSRHRARRVRRPARAVRVPRNGPAHAPALGPHAGPAVLRAVAQPGVDARHPRSAPGRRAARRGVLAAHVPAVLPDPTRRPQRRRSVPRHRRRRLPDRPRQGAVALRPPRRADARLPGRVGRPVGRLRPRPRAGLLSRRSRRLRARTTSSSSATASTC